MTNALLVSYSWVHTNKFLLLLFTTNFLLCLSPCRAIHNTVNMLSLFSVSYFVKMCIVSRCASGGILYMYIVCYKINDECAQPGLAFQFMGDRDHNDDYNDDYTGILESQSVWERKRMGDFVSLLQSIYIFYRLANVM